MRLWAGLIRTPQEKGAVGEGAGGQIVKSTDFPETNPALAGCISGGGE